MIIAVLERSHIAISDEEPIDDSVDDGVEGKLCAKWEDKHGQTNAQDSNQACYPVGESEDGEVADQNAHVGEDYCKSDDGGQVANGQLPIAWIVTCLPL